jgi:hypothetical protein
LQTPTCAGLEEYVLSTYVHLYGRIEEGKKILPPGHFHEVRYEDLLADPEGELRRMYERLELGDFEAARPHVRRYLSEQADYRTNRYKPLPPAQEAEVTRRWGEVIRRYGYERRQAVRA